ncbi:MAG: hypothetical protein ACREEP_03120 [Dongiaceae bacterium]
MSSDLLYNPTRSQKRLRIEYGMAFGPRPRAPCRHTLEEGVMRCRTMLSALFLVILTGIATPADADEAKLKVEVVGPDGKPVTGGGLTFVGYGDKKPIKKPAAGEIIEVRVIDSQGRIGSKVVQVPKSGSLAVVVQVGKSIEPYQMHSDLARMASEAGDFNTFTKHAIQAKESIDAKQAKHDEEQKLVEKWADENNLPTLTYEQVSASIERGKAQGLTDKNSTAT